MKEVRLFAITLLAGMCLVAGSSVSQQIEDYLPNTLLIKAKEPFSSIEFAAGVVMTDQVWFNILSASYNLKEVQSVFRNPHPLLSGWYRVTYDSDVSVPELVTIMKSFPEILASEPEYYVQAQLNAIFPDDPSYPSQW